MLGVEAPTEAEMITWRKRWRKLKQKHGPEFWLKFYSLVVKQVALGDQ
jgi:hypothetical protein